jgi:transcriptional regulator with XRE-family HTH domain
MARGGPRTPQKTADRRVLLELLQTVRKEAGLRQEDLAAAIGRKQAYISKYEQGERRLDLLDLATICDAVGLTLADFAARFDARRLKHKGKPARSRSKEGQGASL